VFKKARTIVTDAEPSGRPSVSARDEKLEDATVVVIRDTGAPLVQKLYTNGTLCVVCRIRQCVRDLDSKVITPKELLDLIRRYETKSRWQSTQ
jgi:hypothetical protein